MDQSIAAACESRREQYSGRGKRPVNSRPRTVISGLAAHRAEQESRQVAAVVVDRLARPGRRRAMPGFLDPGDGGRLAVLAPRRLGLRCMRLGSLGLRRLDLIGRGALLARGAGLIAMAPMPVAWT